MHVLVLLMTACVLPLVSPAKTRRCAVMFNQFDQVLYETDGDIIAAALMDETTALFSRSGILVSNRPWLPWDIALATLNFTHISATAGFRASGVFDADCNIVWQNGAKWHAVPEIVSASSYEDWSYGE